MTDEDRAALAAIRDATKTQAESLADAREKLQLMSGGYLRQLERMLAIEAQLNRIEGLVAGSRPREPTDEETQPESTGELNTAPDIEGALAA
jgi:hypothetical protein